VIHSASRRCPGTFNVPFLSIFSESRALEICTHKTFFCLNNIYNASTYANVAVGFSSRSSLDRAIWDLWVKSTPYLLYRTNCGQDIMNDVCHPLSYDVSFDLEHSLRGDYWNHLPAHMTLQINPKLGPPLMLVFVTMTNILLITSLISILSDSFSKVISHARYVWDILPANKY